MDCIDGYEAMCVDKYLQNLLKSAEQIALSARIVKSAE